jgi:uncharacterized protein (TIGR02452 family)
MNREERKQVAADTLRICERGGFYFDGEWFDISEDISVCVRATEIIDAGLDSGASSSDGRDAGEIYITEENTLDAAKRILDETSRVPLILNFASAKHPGGGFLGGSLSQEEDIAYRSSLYASLSSKKEYYEESLTDLRGGLYFDKQIYSKGLTVFRNSDYTLTAPWQADCISAPAPNRNAALTRGITEEEITNTMHRRAEAVLNTAAAKGAKDIILGAYGCGVFGNNPETVAEVFYTLLNKENKKASFRTITFAIPDKTSKNHKAFAKVFG